MLILVMSNVSKAAEMEKGRLLRGRKSRLAIILGGLIFTFFCSLKSQARSGPLCRDILDDSEARASLQTAARSTGDAGAPLERIGSSQSHRLVITAHADPEVRKLLARVNRLGMGFIHVDKWPKDYVSAYAMKWEVFEDLRIPAEAYESNAKLVDYLTKALEAFELSNRKMTSQLPAGAEALLNRFYEKLGISTVIAWDLDRWTLGCAPDTKSIYLNPRYLKSRATRGVAIASAAVHERVHVITNRLVAAGNVSVGLAGRSMAYSGPPKTGPNWDYSTSWRADELEARVMQAHFLGSTDFTKEEKFGAHQELSSLPERIEEFARTETSLLSKLLAQLDQLQVEFRGHEVSVRQRETGIEVLFPRPISLSDRTARESAEIVFNARIKRVNHLVSRIRAREFEKTFDDVAPPRGTFLGFLLDLLGVFTP